MSSTVEEQEPLTARAPRNDDTAIASTPAEEDAGSSKVKVPRTVTFIIGNEFCERFSFYGMRAILALYLKEKLSMSESGATELVHLFIVAAYLFPLPGAFISDSYLGKFRVILYLSTLYCLGNWLTSLSAFVADTSTEAAYWWCMLGLFLITLGSGGIKPCVSSFGGDQIELTNPPGPARDRLLRWFFSYFYFAINVGSCLSMIAVPILRANLSYATAFAAPACLMMVSVLVFWMGRKLYVHQPPSGNILAQVLRVIWHGLFPPEGSAGATGLGSTPGAQHQITVAEPLAPALLGEVKDSSLGGEGTPSEEGEPLVIRRLHKRGSKRAVLPAGHVAAPHWLDKSKARFGGETVEDVKQLLRVLWLFLPTPIFWSLYDQQASRWTFQAARMDGKLPFGLSIYPDQIQTLNAVGILVMIPLFDQFLYPLAERLGLSIKPIVRMATGMVLCGLSFFITALIEVWIDSCPVSPSLGSAGVFPGYPFTMGAVNSTVPWGAGMRSLLSGGVPLDAALASTASQPCIHMLWQTPQYLMITAAEIMFSITGLELAYSQAPNSMTSVVSAAWLVTDAAGNLFTVLVIKSISPMLSQIQEFMFFGVLCIFGTFLLLLVGRKFVYVESCDN